MRPAVSVAASLQVVLAVGSGDVHLLKGHSTMGETSEDRPVLFVVTLTYTVPLPEIEKHLADHRAWLDQHFQCGDFLASGPRTPRSGGVILARGTSPEELFDLIRDDPFFRAGVARYEITAFEPTRGPLARYLLGQTGRVPLPD